MEKILFGVSKNRAGNIRVARLPVNYSMPTTLLGWSGLGEAFPLGVDLHHRVGRKSRSRPKATDAQLKLLFNLYSFIARRSGS
jgi:hypothetical protein